MKPFKLQTKFFTLEIYRRGIVFTIASLLFLSGVNLCNGNIFVLLISIINKEAFNEDTSEYGFSVGIFLILLSLFLFYLLIINWRIEIYSECFRKVRKSVDAYGTALNVRYTTMNVETLRKNHKICQGQYIETSEYLNENETNLDSETYNTAIELNNKIGELIIEFDTYINEVEKINKNGGMKYYNPDLANKETRNDVKLVRKKLDEFVSLIKKKERFKIKIK